MRCNKSVILVESGEVHLAATSQHASSYATALCIMRAYDVHYLPCQCPKQGCSPSDRATVPCSSLGKASVQKAGLSWQ